MKKIVVVGSINMDLVATVDRMPLAGETISGTSFSTIAGGKGANQAVAAARLGGKVALVGSLGNDAFGRQLRRQLEEDAVDTTSIQQVDLPSGCAVITVAQDGANSIIVIPGANGSIGAAALDAHVGLLREADIILAQLEIPLDTVIRLSKIAAADNTPFMLDPAPARDLPPALLRAVTWITPNESEAISILRSLGRDEGIGSITQETAPLAAERILTSGVRNVVLKMGSQGIFIAGRDAEATFVPSFQVAVVDTTAAGDAFNGGFAYALTELELKPIQAVRFACAVAALSVTRKGAQPSMPLLSEVKNLLMSADAGSNNADRISPSSAIAFK
jgi:ribokinase